MKYKHFFITLILIIISLITISPYLMIIICSFSTNAAIKGNDVFSNLSFDNFLNNFEASINQDNFLTSLFNSFVVASFSTMIGVFISSLAGYAYETYRSKTSEIMFSATVFSIYIPTASIIVPIFLIVRFLNLMNTYFAVIITSLNIPFLVFLFRQNAKGFQKEIINSARIDGANEIKIFFKLFVPYMKPVYLSAIMFSFFDAWNSVMIPVIIIQSPSKLTNSIFLNSIGNIWFSDYAVLMISLLISTLPMFIIFTIFRKYLNTSIF